MSLDDLYDIYLVSFSNIHYRSGTFISRHESSHQFRIISSLASINTQSHNQRTSYTHTYITSHIHHIMDKLLAWSIANESGDKETMDKVGKPDEKALAQLFGGPDEPTLMKQSIQVVENPEADLEAKQVALENFEMLIENMDNANNIENLHLWPSIIGLLNADHDSDLRLLAGSIIAISVQNNPKCQADFLKYLDGFSRLVEYSLDTQTPMNIKLKFLFAISSLIRNHQDSFNYFLKLDGWNTLMISQPSNEFNDKLILRILSIVSSILTNESVFKFEIEPKFQQLNVINNLMTEVSKDLNNINLIEKFLQIIVHLIDLNYKFNDDEIKNLKGFITGIGKYRDDYGEEIKKIESTFH